MSVLSPVPLVWSQMTLQRIPVWLRPTISWLFLFGEPAISIPGLLGGLITWVKVISLFCLLGWTVSWLTAALKERRVARGTWLDIAALVAVIGGLGTVLLRVLETTGRLSAVNLGPVPLVTLLALVCGGVVFLWVEAGLWGAIRRLGRGADLTVLL